MAMNEKLFTITALKSERKQLNSALKSLGKDIIDFQRSKVFEVQGMQMVNYSVVCTEETLNKIIPVINGQRIY